MKRFFLFLLFFAFWNSYADEYHYRNVLIGERAAGMGGAFSAVSDDPSGIYYNPAGLVFSLENYFSLSANAYGVSMQKIKDIVPGQNYTYRSQGLIPAYFGFTQSFGKDKFGFAIVVPNSDLFDQDDQITNLSSATDSANTLKRRFFRQDITYLAGPAYAKELMNNFSVGITLFGFARIDKAIDNQLIIYNPVPTGKYFEQNTYYSRMALGLQPKFGIQYMPLTKYSVGFTVTKPINITGEGKIKRRFTNTDSTTKKPVLQNGSYSADLVDSEQDLYYDIAAPLQFTFGQAYFFSKGFMVTTDIDYYTGDNAFIGFGSSGLLQPVLNWAIGTEYYMTEGVAVRVGAFSNNANTPEIVVGDHDQPNHINMMGGSFSISLFKPGSSFSLGTNYQTGSGQAQAIGGVTNIQDVTQSAMSFFFSGSYQL